MLEILTAGGVYLLDQRLKEQAEEAGPKSKGRALAGGRAVLRCCHNPGCICGSIQIGKEACEGLSAISLGVVLGEYARQALAGGSFAGRVGLSMVLGGGLSNYMDWHTKGFVTDYIRFPSKDPRLDRLVFNLADFAIMGGAALWAVSAIFTGGKGQGEKTRKKRTKKRPKE
ncbi:MAG: signal peptidase II [Eubacteriales bacterium]|nr:signal peptidase II [Eubacteriales bacterium]